MGSKVEGEEGERGFWHLTGSVTLHHVGDGSCCGRLWTPRPPFGCPWGTAKWGGYARTPHVSESGERGVSWKRWIGGDEKSLSPSEIPQVFPGSSGFPVSTFSFFWSLFCCTRVTWLCLGTCATTCGFWVLNAAFVCHARPDVSRYSTPAPMPYNQKNGFLLV